jgi:selenium-binding protein 1
MISSEWTNVGTFDEGFLLSPNTDLDKYGHKIHIWSIRTWTHIQTIDFGLNCIMPLEVRMLRGELEDRGYVSCVVNGTNLNSGIVAFWYDESTSNWQYQTALEITPDPVINPPGFIALPMFNFTFIPPTITDITLSQDNRYMYVSTWLKGYVYQYDITDFKNPVFVDRILLGGFPFIQPNNVTINNITLGGGPQMLRLSPDGQDLFVTNSLFSNWDREFYGTFSNFRSIDKGSWLVRVKTGVVKGVKTSPMSIDPTLFIDFSNEPNGPVRAHEVHIATLGHGH